VCMFLYSASETAVDRKPSFTHQTTVDSTSTDILEYNSRSVLLVTVSELMNTLQCVDNGVVNFVW